VSGDDCPGAACFQLLGKKWTAFIVWALLDGPKRFTELVEAAPGLRDRVLSQRLRELEAAGIVTRSQYLEIPPRVEYELTAAGRALRPVIEEMERWGRRWAAPGTRAGSRGRAGGRRRGSSWRLPVGWERRRAPWR
jgi:DNA-binding HxlR family transcriptional regulator